MSDESLKSTKQSFSNIGVIGLAVMGASLARNFASRGYQASVYNRTYIRTLELTNEYPEGLVGFESLQGFVESLELPRKIIIMVKSGEPVDQVIVELLPFIDRNDIIIDCGNSHYKDTEKRQKELRNKVNYVGCGVSGGSLGALHGPSIMPGGDKHIVEQILPYFRDAAALDFGSKPCTGYIGEGGAGHFVKMVHNGIEYGMMQAIAEVYDILRHENINQKDIKIIFNRLNQGNLKSYLLDITEDILASKIETGEYLLDLVSSKAENKGTGGWTAIAAIELGVAVPSLANALFVRYMSASKKTKTTDKYKSKDVLTSTEMNDLFDNLAKSLELSFFACYIQGLQLLDKANMSYSWGIRIPEVLRVWEGGCIIRSQMILLLKTYYAEKDKDVNHVFIPKIQDSIFVVKEFLSKIVAPTPVINSSIDYIYLSSNIDMSTNLIQAQRDYFGEHTYVRTDTGETVTGGWKRNEDIK